MAKTEKINQRALGILEILASGFCFGFLGLFGKLAYARGIAPGEFLSLRFFVSATLLGAFLFIFAKNEFRLKRKEFWTSLLMGCCGLSLFSSLYFEALQYISASLTVLLLFSFPILVAIGARIFFKEKLGRMGLFALVTTMGGLILLLWNGISISSTKGLALGFASAFSYAFYILVTRAFLRNASPYGSIFIIQASAAIVLGFLSFSDISRPIEILSTAPVLIAGVALVSSLFAMVLFLKGIQKLSSAEVSILSTSEPLTAVFLATLFLDERLANIQYLGGLLVLGGLVLLSLRAK